MNESNLYRILLKIESLGEMRRLICSFFLAVTLLSCSAVNAEVITSVADTFVSNFGANGNANFGGQATMSLRSRADGTFDVGYMRFNFADAGTGVGSLLGSGASLSIAQSGGVALGPQTVEVWGIIQNGNTTSRNWNENGLTFNSTGDELTPAGWMAGPNLTFLGNIGTSNMGTLTSSALDTFLQNSIANNTLVNFMLTTQRNQETLISTREGISTPTLTFSVVPEPSSVLVIAAVAAGALARRRRR